MKFKQRQVSVFRISVSTGKIWESQNATCARTMFVKKGEHKEK